jgi:hypothetical protein
MENPQNISVVEPITPAWNHMVRILFKPFAFKKWLALGFCAFLAQCGEQGGNGFSGFQNQSGSNRVDDAKIWIENNVGLFVTILAGGILLFLLISLLIAWISSRGKFMLIDGIVKNRGAIKEPWAEYKAEGNSLFLFSLVLGFALLFVLAIIVGLATLIALPDIQNDTFGSGAIAAIVVGGGLLLVYLLGCILLSFFVKVLLVPTMYLKRVGAIEGWKIAWNQLLKGHAWQSILLLLMMFLLAIGAGTVAMFAVCLTCCIAALPYVGSVVLLPITVFFVCYALCYIQQFGTEWTFFKNMCRFCNYDLEGHEEGSACPECGK